MPKEPDYGDWFEDVENYEKTEDLTGEDEVTVDVGAGDDGYQFDPPAIRIDQDATVVWEWTGEEAATTSSTFPKTKRNWKSRTRPARTNPSSRPISPTRRGFTFEHQFEDTGRTSTSASPIASRG